MAGLRDSDADFVDQDARNWLAYNPRQAEIDIDRALIERFGLRMFMKLAWHTVESVPYKSNWHIDAVAEHLEAVSHGQIKRLIINIPPRSMKSVSVAVMWPAWDWIRYSWRRFLFSSYAYNLALRDSVRCRQVIQSPWYKERYGAEFRMRRDQNTKRRFDNDQNGYRLCTSVDSQLTGEGGDFVVVDDPHNVRRAESPTARENTTKWWDEAMSSRVNDMETGAFVVIQQRVHQSDLVGHILSKKNNGYTVLCLPAEFDPGHPQRWFRDPRKEKGELLWPAHVNRENLETLKISLGDYAAAAQLQQSPSPREGGIFKAAWFTRRVKFAPADCKWVRAWDWAATEAKLIKSDPDYTATCLIGWSPSQATWYVAHVDRWQVSPGDVRRILKDTAFTDRETRGLVRIELPQDPGSAGKDQVSSMTTDLAGYSVRTSTVTGDKTLRADPVASQAQIGNVVLVDAPWNDMFLAELCSFPTGSHDDMVDAFTHAFNRLTGGRIGILDYYADLVRERRDRETAEAAAKAERQRTGQGENPDQFVVRRESFDLGEVLRPTPHEEDDDDD